MRVNSTLISVITHSGEEGVAERGEVEGEDEEERERFDSGDNLGSKLESKSKSSIPEGFSSSSSSSSSASTSSSSSSPPPLSSLSGLYACA